MQKSVFYFQYQYHQGEIITHSSIHVPKLVTKTLRPAGVQF